MERKYFINSYEDYSPSSADIQTNSVLLTQSSELWKNYMDKLNKLDFSDTSVYTGTSGVALLRLKFEDNTASNLKDILKMLGLKKLKGKRFSFLCGDAGPLAIGAIIYHKLGDSEGCNTAVQKLLDLLPKLNFEDGDIANEYLYGRIGYLYALLYVNQNIVPPPVNDKIIRDIIEAVINWGRNEAAAGSFKIPLMYKWHDSYYLGAAHGLTGILYLLLKAKDYVPETYMKEFIKPSIDYLPTFKYKSGNYPSSINSNRDKYVQWCHGAPGFLFLYCEAYKVFADVKYLQLALECGDVIWERGLLRKGYSICHGVSGNAYCFLELYKATKVPKHLYRATKFAEWCVDYKTAHEEHYPDRPLSLYEGKAGPLFLIMDVKDPLNAKFPGFQL